MLHVALWEPEIPPNTGNIARLCAATETTLHLIGRLGFQIDDRALRRAGLDYWHAVKMHQHKDLAEFREHFQDVRNDPECQIYCLSSHAEKIYTRVSFRRGDCLLFGSESRGLPKNLLAENQENCLTIPMPGQAVRSLNLATSVGIVLYEALRQLQDW